MKKLFLIGGLVLLTGLVLITFFFSVETKEFKYTKPTNIVDSSPAHEEVFAATPKNIVINANKDMTTASNIKIVVLGKNHDFGVGETILSDTKLALRRDLRGLSEGEYWVDYQACFVDKVCQKGRFRFQIDPTRISDYQNLRGQKEVSIDMDQLKFQPSLVIVSPGTKVTWINKERVDHFVNTDPHPSHTFYVDQNSLEIKPGEAFAFTFNEPGEYPYHCSAHVPEGMVGRIIVQN